MARAQWVSDWDRKVAKAIAYLRSLGDTQEARSASSRDGDNISSAQWHDAVKRWKRTQKRQSNPPKGWIPASSVKIERRNGAVKVRIKRR